MMFREDGFRPNDERGFIHKSFIGKAVGGLVETFVPAPIRAGVSLVASGLQRKQKARPTISRTLTARPTAAGAQGKQLGRQLKFGNGNGVALTTAGFAPGVTCAPPAVLDPGSGLCVTKKPGFRGAVERILPGGQTGFLPAAQQPFGDAVMGQFGAALQPGIMMIQRRVCLPGMQIATDGLCYNKGQITNKQREWPRGRRPLLTGGDMRAIGVAARAGAKLDRTTKRLRALGMMKKLPAPRKAAAHPHAKPVAAVSIT